MEGSTRNQNIGGLLFLLGIGLNYLETWYFGWNMHPGSAQEALADASCLLLMLYGIFAMFTNKLKF